LSIGNVQGGGTIASITAPSAPVASDGALTVSNVAPTAAGTQSYTGASVILPSVNSPATPVNVTATSGGASVNLIGGSQVGRIVAPGQSVVITSAGPLTPPAQAVQASDAILEVTGNIGTSPTLGFGFRFADGTTRVEYRVPGTATVILEGPESLRSSIFAGPGSPLNFIFNGTSAQGISTLVGGTAAGSLVNDLVEDSNEELRPGRVSETMDRSLEGEPSAGTPSLIRVQPPGVRLP